MKSRKTNYVFATILLLVLSNIFVQCYLVRTCDAEGAAFCGELNLTFENSSSIATRGGLIDSLTFKFNAVDKKFERRKDNEVNFKGLSGCSGGKNLKIFDKNNLLIAEANLEFGDYETRTGCGCWPALKRVVGVRKIRDASGVCNVSTTVTID